MYVDIGKMKMIVEKSKEPIEYKHPFKPLINEIVAMVREGALHRYVVVWANDTVGLQGEARLTRDKLTAGIDYWKRSGKIDERKVEFLRQQIRAFKEKSPITVPEKKIEVGQEVKKEVVKNEEKQGAVAVNPFENL